MKKEWKIYEFEKCLQKIPRYNKIPKNKFLLEGIFPIISQEKDFINGYWDNFEDVIEVKKPVVIFGDHTKVVKLIDFNFVVGADGVKIFQPIDEINAEYLAFFLQNIQLDDLGYARHYRLLKKVNVPIPPLEEQQTIVAKLDQAFAAIDQAKANIEKNIANAKELFQSKLNQIFSQKGDGWEEKMIIELCKHKSQIVGGPFGSNLKVSDYKESGIPILRLQNIGKGYFIDKDIKYISEEKAEELSYHSFKSGDIVLAKLGIPIGKTCMVPEDFDYGIVVADVVRIRPNIDEINYDFLKHFLNSDNAVSQLTADIKGATRPRVNIDEVRNLKLSIPSLSIQIKIVEEIDNLEKLRNELITKYQQKLANLEELKKSILEKAFKGELITQKIEV